MSWKIDNIALKVFIFIFLFMEIIISLKNDIFFKFLMLNH
jgi:hypothetical protein